jgi:sulfocyanin
MYNEEGMEMTRVHHVGAAAVVAVAAVVAALAFAPGGGAAGKAAFTIIAGQTPANGGLNFNGTDKGHLVITVPVGAQVQLTLVNKGDLPHSLQIISYRDQPPATALPHPVFPGAETPNPQEGIMKGKTAVATFTPSKPGKYLFICGFPGHALLGMYGIFEVSPNPDTKPSIVTK